MAGDDPDLFCVGDPNQSIYGFNGANPQLLQEIVRTGPTPGARPHAQSSFDRAHHRVASTLLEDGAAGIVPAKDDGDVPMVRAYNTDAEEASTWPRGWPLTISRNDVGVRWVLARTTRNSKSSPVPRRRRRS